MPVLLVVVAFLSAAAPAAAAPSIADLIGSDPFSLLSVADGGAVSLQEARGAAGTHAEKASYLGGARGEQLLRLRSSGEQGWYYIGAGDATGVLEVRESPRETVVVLAEPTGAEGEKWRFELESPGRYRVVSKTRNLLLSPAPGARRSLTVLPASAGVEQRWRILLHPSRLADPGPEGTLGLVERFPSLARQLAVNRESWLDHLLAARRLEDYCSLGGSELMKGMGLLLQDRLAALAPEGRNYALTLLLWLLSQAAYARGDSITIALALANASLYAAGDEAVRERIRRDVVAHYKLYRSVTEWQKGWAIAYRLADVPLMAKVLWCYRANQLEQNGRTLTMEEYETFVDRIEVLQEMQAWIRAHELAEAQSLRGILSGIDGLFRGAYRYAHFMAMIRQWYAPTAPLPDKPTDDELYAYLTRPEIAKSLPEWVHEVLEDYRNGGYYVEVLGRRRDPQARMWVNYQWRLYRESGYFRGDCGTEAEVSMALWKAAGIPALAVYHTGTDIGHAYAMYYDPFVGRFLALQDLAFMVEKHGATSEVTLHPMPIRIHDSLPFLRPQPRTTIESYTRFVARGIEVGLLEAMYLDRGGGARPEEVFAPSRCPAESQDQDRDGLRDEDEGSHGTRPDDPDTDRDGFSDLWEVERAFGALDPASPNRVDLGKVLVGHVVQIRSARTGVALGAAGSGAADGRPGYRIVRSDEAQYHYLVAADSGLCVTAGDRARVVLAPLTGSGAQKWKLLFRESGTFAVQSLANGSVLALENGGELEARSPRGTREETWVIR